MNSTTAPIAARDATDSLAPLQLERLSVEAEVAQMNRGKGGKLALAALAVGLVLAGGAYWMKRVDVAQSYAAAEQGVAQINDREALAFMRCTLPDVQPSQLASAEALHGAIEIASERSKKSYARTLAHCSPMLDDLAREVATINAPTDVKPQLAVLERAVENLQRGLNRYQAYLDDPKLEYDYVQAAPMIEGIAVAWERYQRVRSQVSGDIRTKE